MDADPPHTQLIPVTAATLVKCPQTRYQVGQPACDVLGQVPAPFLQQADRFVDRGSRALDISGYGRAIGNLGGKPWVLDRAERDVQLARSLAQ